MTEEIKVNKANKSITFIKNGIAFSQFGIATEILDYITNIQQNLEVSQTNEETYRLEMQEITKIFGLDEHTLFDDVKEYATNLQQENEKLKYWLNDVIFDENNIDIELPARYLRKLGYIDFDDENKVYINKHNNSPFMQEDNKEKAFYLKDEELSEYTKQLESQNRDYKSRCEKANKWVDKHTEIYTKNGISIIDWDNLSDPRKLKNILKGSDENENSN